VFFDEKKDRRAAHIIRDRGGKIMMKRIAFSRCSRLMNWMVLISFIPDDAMPFVAAEAQSRCYSSVACGLTFLSRGAESAEIGPGRLDPESGAHAPRQGQRRRPCFCVT
jgi:hypothetical protein